MGKKEKSPNIKLEIVDKMAALITAAFGLVAALAWNDLVKKIFSDIFGNVSAVIPMIIYAFVVTVIAVLLTLTMARASSKAKSVMITKIFRCKLCPYTTKLESEFLEHNVKNHAASPDKFMMK